jgi:hypothetical protein
MVSGKDVPGTGLRSVGVTPALLLDLDLEPYRDHGVRALYLAQAGHRTRGGASPASAAAPAGSRRRVPRSAQTAAGKAHPEEGSLEHTAGTVEVRRGAERAGRTG